MQIFIDSANPDQIRAAQTWGRIDGVTTNPSLVASVGKPYGQLVHELLEIVSGSISLEVIATDFGSMMVQARQLARLSHKVVVKIPCTTDGLQAVQHLTREGIKTNVTLVFSLSQAILAAKAGATYCSVFVGRLEDVAEHSGDELLAQVRTLYDDHKVSTKLLAASIRNEDHFEQALLVGADIVTVPYPVLERLSKHSLTDLGLQRFLEDWSRAQLDFPA